MIVQGLLVNLTVLLGAMIIMWLISVRIRDVSFIDAFWGLGMAIMACGAFFQIAQPGPLAMLLCGLASLWGLRLGLYLIWRWRKEGEDPRYTRIMASAEKKGWSFASAALVKVWLLQIPLLFLVSSPAHFGILIAGQQAPGPLALLGGVIALFGIGFETVGDLQLASFKADPANKGKVLDTGLWRYTRHPNYFGDACAWWGIFLVSLETGALAWLTVLGPIFLTFTLTKWSGKPLLEYSLRKNRPDYAEYIERTSGFIPWPPKKIQTK